MDTPLTTVIGDRSAKVLDKALSLTTVGGLLRHYPRRYSERGELTEVSRLTVGDQVTVQARVQKVNARPMRNRRGTLLEVRVGDRTGSLTLTFFNQKWRERELRVGRLGLFAGTVGEFRGNRQLANPDYMLITDVAGPEGPSLQVVEDGDVDDFAGGLIPVYPATAGARTWTIAQCVRIALDTLDPPEDPLPDRLRTQRGLLDLGTALKGIHRPDSRAQLEAARERLVFDEAFVLQTTLARRAHDARAEPAIARPSSSDGLRAAFDARLPFTLTEGQLEVGAQIDDDLALEHPMHRLLQGEVGSGKTVAALRAMLTVVDAGGQCAMLAPTEVLAAQHARSLRALLGPLGAAGELGAADVATSVLLVTGSQGAAVRRAGRAAIADGSAGIVIGTHALISEGVEFADLGLLVVDEQHRFGVQQRDALRSRGERPPHVLVMTATPIPRTVAMTVFGDLETSTLRQVPAGRSPVVSHVVPAGDQRWMDRTWARLREEVAAGHQAFVVCPRIGEEAAGDDPASHAEPAADAVDEPDPEEKRPAAAVLEVLPELTGGALAGVRITALHGRMSSEDKDAVMSRFVAGDIDVLVATTVIEVGVDVPNATVMVILDADRFGVSALHQLRGRVGRGSAPAVCLLVGGAPPDSPAGQRLSAVAATSDGFELAQLDLELRREGDVLGVSQSGRRTQLKLLSLLRDTDVIVAAREAAIDLVSQDPQLHEHPALRDAVEDLVDDERAEFLEKA